jgi:hypothetical protein
MMIIFFWVSSRCRFVGRYQLFGPEAATQHGAYLPSSLLFQRSWCCPPGYALKFDPFQGPKKRKTSNLKMETVCFSETLVSTCESTRRQNPEEHLHPHRRVNFRSRNNYNVHGIPPPDPIFSHINPVHTFIPCLFETHCVLSSHLSLGPPSCLFPSGFWQKLSIVNLISPMFATLTRETLKHGTWLEQEVGIRSVDW